MFLPFAYALLHCGGPTRAVAPLDGKETCFTRAPRSGRRPAPTPATATRLRSSNKAASLAQKDDLRKAEIRKRLSCAELADENTRSRGAAARSQVTLLPDATRRKLRFAAPRPPELGGGGGQAG